MHPRRALLSCLMKQLYAGGAAGETPERALRYSSRTGTERKSQVCFCPRNPLYAACAGQAACRAALMPAEAAHAQKKAQSADAGDCVRHTVRQNRHDRTAAAQYTAETCPKPAARRGYGSSSAAAAAAAERAGRKGTGTAKAENAAKILGVI